MVLGAIRRTLELLDRGQGPHDLGSGLFSEDGDGPLQSESGEWRHGDSEPEIEIVIAFVVLRHTWVSIDDTRSIIDAVRMNARRDKTRLVTESAKIEGRGDLTDQTFLLELVRPLDHLFFGHVDLLSDDCERRGHERNLTLQSP